MWCVDPTAVTSHAIVVISWVRIYIWLLCYIWLSYDKLVLSWLTVLFTLSLSLHCHYLKVKYDMCAWSSLCLFLSLFILWFMSFRRWPWCWASLSYCPWPWFRYSLSLIYAWCDSQDRQWWVRLAEWYSSMFLYLFREPQTRRKCVGPLSHVIAWKPKRLSEVVAHNDNATVVFFMSSYGGRVPTHLCT